MSTHNCTERQVTCQQQLFGSFPWGDSGSEYLDKNQDLHKQKECLNLLILTTLAWRFFLLLMVPFFLFSLLLEECFSSYTWKVKEA